MNDFSTDLLSRLTTITGEKNLISGKENLSEYLKERRYALSTLPVAVIFPENEEQIVQAIKEASKQNVSILSQGGGSSLKYSQQDLTDTLIINLTRMNRIIEIDDKNLMVTTEPGVTLADLKEAAKEKYLYLPLEPAVIENPTMGGIVAENAHSLFFAKYGGTDDFVIGVRLVNGKGEVVNAGLKAIKDVAGYSLAKFMVGSRGTLGVITRVLLKLVPFPASSMMVKAHFPSLSAAINTALAIVDTKKNPTMLELLDEQSCRSVERYMKTTFAPERGSVLLVKFDGHPSAVNEDIEMIMNVCREKGSENVEKIDDPEAVEDLLTIRKSLTSAFFQTHPSSAMLQIKVMRNCVNKVAEKFFDILEKHRIKGSLFGNAGKGYLTLLISDDTGSERAGPGLLEASNDLIALFEENNGKILRRVSRIEGIFSGHYGITPQTRLLMKKIKAVFDPDDLFK